MSPIEQLTERQRLVTISFATRSSIVAMGRRVREIGECFKHQFSHGVMCHLKALEKKGLIRRSPNKSRAIELTQHREASGNVLGGRGCGGHDEPAL